MPNFHVLQCFSCHTYQVHQETKSNKWKCKLCGENQSIIKIFGKGSGKDCRQHVQKLNMLRCEKDEMLHTVMHQPNDHLRQKPLRPCQEEQASKWEKYLDPGTREVLADVDDNREADTDEQWVSDQQACSEAKYNKRRMGKEICSQRKRTKLDLRFSLSEDTELKSDVKASLCTRPYNGRKNHDMDPGRRDADLATDVNVCGRHCLSGRKVISQSVIYSSDVHESDGKDKNINCYKPRAVQHWSDAADGHNNYFGELCHKTDGRVSHHKPCPEQCKSGAAARSKWEMYLVDEPDDEGENILADGAEMAEDNFVLSA